MDRFGKLTRQLESTVGRLLGTQDAGDGSEPLALVTRILRDAEQRIEPIGGGRRRYPFTHLTVIVLAPRKEEQDRYTVALEDLSAKIRERLAELDCEPPARFEVAVQFVRKARKNWTEDQHVELAFSRDTPGASSASNASSMTTSATSATSARSASTRASLPASGSGSGSGSASGLGSASASASASGSASASPSVSPSAPTSASGASSAAAPPVRISILRGTCAKRTYALHQSTIRLGRGTEHAESSGRTRHNDIAFADDEDEVNRTVARAQAHLRFNPERREFRLFDDGSSNGTRIVRDAEIITVTPHGPRGVRIVSGDIIELGRARVRIDVDA